MSILPTSCGENAARLGFLLQTLGYLKRFMSRKASDNQELEQLNSKFSRFLRNASRFASTTRVGIGADSARSVALNRRVLAAARRERRERYLMMVRINVMYFDN